MQENHAVDVHGNEAAGRNAARIRKYSILLGILALIAIAGVCVSLVWRDPSQMNNPNEMPSQLVTIAITLVFGVLIIFLWGMKMTPVLSYRYYLKEIHRGLSRYEEGTATQVDTQTTFRDGLSFYGIILNVGDPDNPEDDRLLYWDAQLGQPPFAQGNRLRIHAHGNDILGYEVLTAQA